MDRQRIYVLKGRQLNDTERLEICRLLIKAGYTAKIDRERQQNKNTYIHYIEFWEDKSE